MFANIPELIISEELEATLLHCELTCVIGCCGIEAFDFSPLMLAHFFVNRNWGDYSDAVTHHVRADLEQLLKIAESYPDSLDKVCYIKCLNTNFTKQSLISFLTEVLTNISRINNILNLSEDIRHKVENDQK